jgi:Prp8 binding protein
MGCSITSVALSKDREEVFIGGIDNSIRAVSLKKNAIEYSLVGHNDTITSISLSNSGSYLLSNSMDNTMMIWDVRPFVEDGKRSVRTLIGHSHNYEKNLIGCDWSWDDQYVASGSADRCVYVWNSKTGKIAHQLGGNKG